MEEKGDKEEEKSDVVARRSSGIKVRRSWKASEMRVLGASRTGWHGGKDVCALVWTERTLLRKTWRSAAIKG